MASYNPDNYVLVKHTDPQDKDEWFYRLIGGWGGGYLSGDSWRANSGIVKVKHHKKDGRYTVYGGSGSAYTVYGEPRMTMAVNMGWSYIEEGCKKLGLELEAVDWDDLKAAGIEWEDVE